jgi:geranylgeranyl diphosphate synthase type II
LIHDDLPAMDDDDYRRGQLSNHKKYGEDLAILSGDALLSLAFQVMDSRVVSKVAKAIGSEGVVGGQVVDILLAKGYEKLSLPLIEYIHKHKTGKLIAVACEAGAVLAGTDEETVAAMGSYGERIGFAFQIIDDVFDDENYAILEGSEKAYEKARECISLAKKELEILDLDTRVYLEQLADFVAERKY